MGSLESAKSKINNNRRHQVLDQSLNTLMIDENADLVDDDDDDAGGFVDRLNVFQQVGRTATIHKDSEKRAAAIENFDSSEKNLTDETGFERTQIDPETVDLYLSQPIVMRRPETLPDMSDCQRKLKLQGQNKPEVDENFMRQDSIDYSKEPREEDDFLNLI